MRPPVLLSTPSAAVREDKLGFFPVLNCTVNVQFISPVQIIILLTWPFFLEVSRPTFYMWQIHHRNTKWLRLKGTSGAHLVSPAQTGLSRAICWRSCPDGLGLYLLGQQSPHLPPPPPAGIQRPPEHSQIGTQLTLQENVDRTIKMFRTEEFCLSLSSVILVSSELLQDNALFPIEG